MTKHDYTKLDAAILDSIQKASGPLSFTGLHSGKVASEASKLESAVRGKSAGPRDDKPAWRFIDNRLQALRRAGKIRYQRKPEGWLIGQAPKKADGVAK